MNLTFFDVSKIRYVEWRKYLLEAANQGFISEQELRDQLTLLDRQERVTDA